MHATTAVFFDMDGTLLDSRLDFDLIRHELGLAGVPILEAMESMTDADRRNAERVLERHEQRAAQEGTLFAHARETLTDLAGRNVRVGLMTRNSRRSVDSFLAKHQLAFDAIRTRDDGINKPSPEPVWALCRSLNVEPADTMLVGDYLFDLQAARAAGSLAVLIVRGNEMPEFADQADEIIGSLREVGPLLDKRVNR